MAINNKDFSFAPGYILLRKDQKKEVKDEIMKLLGTDDPSFFSRRKTCYRNIPQHIYEGISQIFLRRGLHEVEVWQYRNCEK